MRPRKAHQQAFCSAWTEPFDEPEHPGFRGYAPRPDGTIHEEAEATLCGIAGVLDVRRATTPEELAGFASTMSETLRHRGPDDGGVWADGSAGVALANRRLAVLDLSPAGHQPMHSRSGRYTMVFNGEIYNHRDLRRRVENGGPALRGHSDTEVLLAAVDAWGLERALGECNGMFALALWDAGSRSLKLARDRLGEKPLYYGWAGAHVVFGSELKALRAHPAFVPHVDRGALALYLRLTFVPSPHCIFERVYKLSPGTVLTIPEGLGVGSALPVAVPFWSLRRAVETGRAEPFAGSPRDAVDRLEELLVDAVGLRLDADVPVGAFLSGGVDSSTVAALMQARLGRPVRTFTISMPDAGFDESDDARAVADHLGTRHVSVELSASDALDAIPRLPGIYDEPFADPSQLPTLLVAEVARAEVTVALSGDGGDEVFAGYNRHVLSRYAWRRVGRVPLPLRRLGARALLGVGHDRWDAVVGAVGPHLPGSLRVRNPGDKVQKLAELLRVPDAGALYPALVTQWDGAGLTGVDAVPGTLMDDRSSWPRSLDSTELMMFLDTAIALPDGMLTKVDRATMAVGLEARVPFLDHRVVEFAWTLPLDLKIRDNRGKWALRRVLDRHVPKALVDRPKMGFDPPVGSWLKGPLREWSESLLDARRLADEGWLQPGPVRQRWSEHVSGRRNWDYPLWTVLMFQAWLDSA